MFKIFVLTFLGACVGLTSMFLFFVYVLEPFAEWFTKYVLEPFAEWFTKIVMNDPLVGWSAMIIAISVVVAVFFTLFNYLEGNE